jgi:tRNA (guanine-N7-)-methyltransferase
VTVRKPRRLPPDQLAPYQIDAPAVHERDRTAGPLDWRAVFGNDRPVEMEVGFGKGLFLVNSALARLDVNFLGIEIVRKYQLYATQRVAIRNLTNVRTCCADAKRVLRELVVAASVAAVHVYFPDPWWKKRHKKRLLFTPDFAAEVNRVLRPGGRLHFASDVEDYFAMVTAILDGMPGFTRRAPPDEQAPSHDMDYLTNFERKSRKQGRPVYRAEYEKGN